MTILEIYNLEDAEQANVLSSLLEGEHIIGRGAILRCNDKRVSRKHALITVSKDGASIKAVHINPCFFKASNGNIITILPENSEVPLRDGDQFALLADLFWFKVKLIPSNDNCNGDTTAPEINLICSSIQSGSTTKRCSNEETTTDACKRQKLSNEDQDNVASTSTSPSNNSSPNKNTSHINTASHDKDVSSGRSTPSLDLLLDTSNNITVPESEVIPEDSLSKNINPEALITNLVSIIKEDFGDRSTNFKNNEVQNKPSESVKVKNKDVSSSEEENEKPSEPKLKRKSVSDSEEEQKEDIKVSNIIDNAQAGVNQNEDDTEKDTDNKKGDNDATMNTNPDASGSKDENKKKSRRERCWYGPTCYRRNPIHRQDFSHPGDDDYNSDPDDDRPDCPFGAACYRRNLAHRRQYKHPNPPAVKPNDGDGDGKRKKKKRSPKKKAKPTSGESEDSEYSGDNNSENDDAGNGTKRKKRKAAMKKLKTQDSSEDDYDYNDPFIDDATSDEFELSDDDDESTDWEDSQQVDEESQNTRRLLKEAKRFTKGKKKQDD